MARPVERWSLLATRSPARCSVGGARVARTRCVHKTIPVRLCANEKAKYQTSTFVLTESAHNRIGMDRFEQFRPNGFDCAHSDICFHAFICAQTKYFGMSRANRTKQARLW